MTIYTWTANYNHTIRYAPGDVIKITGVRGADLYVAFVEGMLNLTTFDDAELTINAGSGALDPASVAIQFDDGGRFHYATGATLVQGGTGADLMLGDAGNNQINGGPGSDSVEGGGGQDVLNGGNGNDFISSGNAYDPVTLRYLDDLVGDVLNGGAGHDSMYGGDGADTLDGGSGTNLMYGGLGDDTYIVRSFYDDVYDSGGKDRGTIHVDWYKPASTVEQWTWADGVQRLPYWLDALTFDYMNEIVPQISETGVVYYHFAETPPEFFTEEDRDSFNPFTNAQKDYTQRAFDYLSSLIDLRFEQSTTPDKAFTIVLGNNYQAESGGYAATVTPGGGSVLLLDTNSFVKNPNRDDGESLFSILMHELGHSLGLKHPFLNSDSEAVGQAPYLPALEDSTSLTLMSYTDDKEGDYGSYSMLDIAALQYLHGVSSRANPGDSRYTLADTGQRLIYDGGGSDTIDGSALALDLTLYLEPGYWSHAGAKGQYISGSGQYSINFGSVIEHASGGKGHDSLSGNDQANRLSGNGGNDRFTGKGGDDTIDGGAGRDTAIYGGARASYTTSVQNGAFRVADTRSGADGTDTLSNVERILFQDTALALDVGADGIGGQVYRLYQAAFDRKPDLAGVGYWIAQADQGQSLLQIAGNFLGSKEFSDLYGGPSPSAAQYITLLYNNVLHRPYEQAGFDYWVGVLGNGLGRADVLQNFAASAENQAQVASVIGGGFAYTPYG